MAGNYVVNVYVQASDNSTVTKTYNYTATADGPIPTQPVTAEQPTTAKPTTPVATTAPVTTTPQPTTPSGYNKGDANMDHYFNIKDATYVQMHVAEYDEAKDIVIALADMSGDGRITVLDATLIQQALLK